MKVLMISGDSHLLEPGTPAHARLELQRSQVEQLDVFVWPRVHSWREIACAAKANQYDVVTAQDPFWRGLLAWRAAKRRLPAGRQARLNVQVHSDLAAQSFFRHMLAHVVLRHADSVRVVSEKIQKQVIRMGVCAPIHVLPIFIDVSHFRTLEHKPHAQKTMLWIGRFEAEKDPLEAIRVLKQVREAGINVKLIMLGSGSLEGELRKVAHGLPVEFPGWQDTKPYLEVADVVLSTSRHESYGASIVEALAAGVPVVAPDVGIAREAGAIVVAKSDFTRAVTGALNSNQRGELKITLLSAEEWAKRWKETLT